MRELVSGVDSVHEVDWTVGDISTCEPPAALVSIPVFEEIMVVER